MEPQSSEHTRSTPPVDLPPKNESKATPVEPRPVNVSNNVVTDAPIGTTAREGEGHLTQSSSSKEESVQSRTGENVDTNKRTPAPQGTPSSTQPALPQEDKETQHSETAKTSLTEVITDTAGQWGSRLGRLRKMVTTGSPRPEQEHSTQDKVSTSSSVRSVMAVAPGIN